MEVDYDEEEEEHDGIDDEIEDDVESTGGKDEL